MLLLLEMVTVLVLVEKENAGSNHKAIFFNSSLSIFTVCCQWHRHYLQTKTARLLQIQIFFLSECIVAGILHVLESIELLYFLKLVCLTESLLSLILPYLSFPLCLCVPHL